MPHFHVSHPARIFRVLRAAALLCCLLAAGCTTLFPTPAPTPQDSGSGEQAQTDAWVRGLAGLTPMEQARQAEMVWRDETRPAALRQRAMFILSTRPSSQSLAAQQALSREWIAAGAAGRAAMERTLVADLLTTDDDALRLAASIPPSQEKTFPWNFLSWQAARRGLLADNAGTIDRLSDPSLYADPSLLGLSADRTSAPPETPGPSLTTPLSGRVALALPLSGPFGGIGKQVAAGAQAAVRELAARHVSMDVRIIDSERPDWLEQIAALPADCVTVGGPLQAEACAAMRQTGLPGRVQFAFLPRLPNPAEEGVTVWRFFTSPRDQLDAVLDFAAGELGIRSYGVLAPQDPYGQRMAELFLQAAGQRGLDVATGSYPPEDMKSWTKITGNFVGAVATERGRIPRARASFEAVFLPDSWKNMDMLISTLHYHGASRMVMLGTSLWEQGLSSVRGLTPSTFALAVFPGAWNSQADSAAARALIGDMAPAGRSIDDWTVLGFDFVRFAAALGLDAPLDAAALNQRLSATTLDWAGAPITWNGQGQASRRLFLFQPTRDGMIPLDRAAFRAYRDGGGRLPNVPAAAPLSEEAPGMTPAEERDLTDLINSITGGASASDPAETSAAPAN